MNKVSLSGGSATRTSGNSKPIGFLQYLSGTSKVKTRIEVIREIIIRIEDDIFFFDKYQDPIFNYCIGCTIMARPPPSYEINSSPSTSIKNFPLTKKMLYEIIPEVTRGDNQCLLLN